MSVQAEGRDCNSSSCIHINITDILLKKNKTKVLSSVLWAMKKHLHIAQREPDGRMEIRIIERIRE